MTRADTDRAWADERLADMHRTDGPGQAGCCAACAAPPTERELGLSRHPIPDAARHCPALAAARHPANARPQPAPASAPAGLGRAAVSWRYA